MDYTKTVVEPIRQVVPRYTLRGFKEDYADVDADVLLIEGEIHLGRKPVSVNVLAVIGALSCSRLCFREVFSSPPPKRAENLHEVS